MLLVDLLALAHNIFFGCRLFLWARTLFRHPESPLAPRALPPRRGRFSFRELFSDTSAKNE
jgi:hypothetical protein